MPRAIFRSRDDRYQETGAWLALRGFQTERTPPDVLGRYQPWGLPPTDYCFIRAAGRLGEAKLEIFEYDYHVTRQNGRLSSGDQTIAILSHGRIDGSARILSHAQRFAALSPAVRALLWVPPLVLARGAAWLWDRKSGDQPDQRTGDALFDRTYAVKTSSAEMMSRSVTPLLRGFLLKSGFRGCLEIRPGLLLYAIEGVCFDGEGLLPLLELARGFLEVVPKPREHPLR